MMLGKKITRKGWQITEYGLSRIEPFWVKNKRLSASLSYPPVFIIGPPRSGTTLLSQLLLQKYKFGYFYNLLSHFYLAPITAISMFQRFSPQDKLNGNYHSEYGQTRKWYEPHEGGRFWYRWFPSGDYVYVGAGQFPQSKSKELQETVDALSKGVGSSFLFKNTYNSMRIAPIMETFPDACFLVSQRNPIDTAQSILKGRKQAYGNKEKWFSVPPRQIDEIRQHPYWQQVVEQVYYVYQQIEQDKQYYGQSRFLDVNYEMLCKNSHQCINDIGSFLEGHGIYLETKGIIPEQQTYSTGMKIDRDDYQKISDTVKQLWGESR